MKICIVYGIFDLITHVLAMVDGCLHGLGHGILWIWSFVALWDFLKPLNKSKMELLI
jgi:hypothetical protein